jgi:hypothetical protein
MTSNSDDLEEQLRQNLKLRRELAAEVAKARDSSEQRGNFASAPKTSHHMPAKVTTTAASLEEKSDRLRREGSRAGLLVAVIFLMLAAGVLLTVVTFWPVFTTAPVIEKPLKAR